MPTMVILKTTIPIDRILTEEQNIDMIIMLWYVWFLLLI